VFDLKRDSRVSFRCSSVLLRKVNAYIAKRNRKKDVGLYSIADFFVDVCTHFFNMAKD